ncbi:MAG: nucleotidyltransferase family protein [Planctomycetota bacterium]
MSINRAIAAVQQVRQRLFAVTTALENEEIPYAVIGGNAVAAHVATVDEAGVRNTRDVDVVLHWDDLRRASEALAAAGFIQYEGKAGISFHDRSEPKPRFDVDLVRAGVSIDPQLRIVHPGPKNFDRLSGMRVLPLIDLVTVKLGQHRIVDRVHVRDMIDIGLVDETWLDRLQPELVARLKELLDDPHG